MASYLNAHHLNTRFKLMICALAIASVTERTCVLSIIPVVTIIRITQGMRNGGCKLTFLQARGKLLLLQGLLSISRGNWTIEILRVNCKYLIEMRSLWGD